MADYCDILRCDVLGPRLAAAERASAAGSTLPDKPKADDNCGAPPADHPRCSCDQKHMRALQQKCRVRGTSWPPAGYGASPMADLCSH